MKNFSFLLLSIPMMMLSACDKNAELNTADAIVSLRSQEESLPATNFSRGFGINNAGTLVGSVLNEDGTVVAYKLSNNELWLSEEAVAPNGKPEIRFSINDRGDVAGHKLVPGGIAPVYWENGVAHDLAILPGYDFGEVFDINASGQMVGECLNGNFVTPTAMRAVLYATDGDPLDLGTLGGTKASAESINDCGDIVGTAENALGQFRAFLYKDGVMTDIGTLGGTIANANAINNRGDIVGRSLLANGAIRAFLYSDGVMTDLGTLGGVSSVAFDVNDHGDVVGLSRISSGQVHAFLYSDGVMTDLNALGGIDSRALSINNRGDVTGHYTLPDGTIHGFLYTDGEMISLQ